MASVNILSKLKNVRKGQNLSVLDIISIENLTLSDLELIFALTRIFKDLVETGGKKCDLLKGKTIVNFFNENSTRTRSSFELAGKHLGADVINVSGSASSGKKGETLGDSARTLDALNADLLIIRDANSGAPFQLASLIQAPLINAGDGWHEHPTQALLEAFTLREKVGKKKLTYLFVGDALHSRVFGSQVRLYQKLGFEIRLAAPATLIPKNVENWGVKVFYKIEDALPGCDAIHAIRLQTERAAGKFVATGREYSKNYCINPARVKLANKNAVILHAGPVIREFDIRTEVLESKQCLVQDMVQNGLPTRMALTWLLITSKLKKTNPWK
ncbi:aspartate carbamoyltransferase catalytic subunit [Candidatus Gracilibacteria bacterium]|nr:aspartate carbamoyltransferase catalytic subunit [Candidatus Gracilibacteria bacterium]MCF7856634.1 aspartate carbamoyltransferase catalytic subunit [Candidatus Gracilibacteria bacterium]MCF7896934.1 aspartate carbamoyltransferase catalytic subunit [Candidatus Gracilibacteria bacterium]